MNTYDFIIIVFLKKEKNGLFVFAHVFKSCMHTPTLLLDSFTFTRARWNFEFYSRSRHHDVNLAVFFFDFSRMPVDFYYTPGSPPCRAVLLTAKALGLELNLKPLDLHHGEHLKPEFVKVKFRNNFHRRGVRQCNRLTEIICVFFLFVLQLNPQHTVPTLVDGDLVLWERWVGSSDCSKIVSTLSLVTVHVSTSRQLRTCGRRLWGGHSPTRVANYFVGVLLIGVHNNIWRGEGCCIQEKYIRSMSEWYLF